MPKKKIEAAILQLIQWIGDDPSRTGLKDTPAKVTDRLLKVFSGYKADLDALINCKGIENSTNSNTTIKINDIEFISFCEHHMLPIIGKVDIEYIPTNKLVGIGHIIKIVHAFTNRLQIQERMTTQIAESLNACLKPKGLRVSIKAKHYCTDASVTGKLFTDLHTQCALGVFKTEGASLE